MKQTMNNNSVLVELTPGSFVLHGVGVRVNLIEREVTVLHDTYSVRGAKLLRQRIRAMEEAADLLEAMKEER